LHLDILNKHEHPPIENLVWRGGGALGMIAHQFIRYVIAILAAVIIGQVVQVAAAIFSDLMAGAEVTGGRWSLNVANVAVICVQGAAVGCVAGAIARKRGILISAVAVLLPLIIFVLIELIENRDFSNYIATEYDTNPALWTWIALIPAMICGHFSARFSYSGGRVCAHFLRPYLVAPLRLA